MLNNHYFKVKDWTVVSKNETQIADPNQIDEKVNNEPTIVADYNPIQETYYQQQETYQSIMNSNDLDLTQTVSSASLNQQHHQYNSDLYYHYSYQYQQNGNFYPNDSSNLLNDENQMMSTSSSSSITSSSCSYNSSNQYYFNSKFTNLDSNDFFIDNDSVSLLG